MTAACPRATRPAWSGLRAGDGPPAWRDAEVTSLVISLTGEQVDAVLGLGEELVVVLASSEGSPKSAYSLRPETFRTRIV